MNRNRHLSLEILEDRILLDAYVWDPPKAQGPLGALWSRSFNWKNETNDNAMTVPGNKPDDTATFDGTSKFDCVASGPKPVAKIELTKDFKGKLIFSGISEDPASVVGEEGSFVMAGGTLVMGKSKGTS